MTLVFASNNAHKLEEVRAIMPAHIRIISPKDIGFDQEIAETGTTLEQNSEIKARALVDFIRRQPSAVSTPIDGVFADDTGLEIDALNGAPGVYTARWYLMPTPSQCSTGKEPNTEMMIFAANRAKALQSLEGKENRQAQFRTVITLIRWENGASHVQDATLQVEGIVRGRIAEEEYGLGGFGYDPIFIPEGYDKTFGELPASLKNTISHRARAMEALVKVLSC